MYEGPAEGAMHVLDELAARGFIKQCSDLDGLRARLDAGPVVYYAGFDPTADSLHVGHLLPILLMTHLQRAGHRPIAVVGGGTGMIGDPSGKTEARMLLDEAAIAHNLACQQEQIGRFLTFGDDAGRMVNNAEWLCSLQLIPFLRDIGSAFSVNRMLAAEGYKQRLERGLSFIEFNYQILQAYDFLVLNERYGCAVQLGGDDQWGNILAGVDLVRRRRETQVFALTLPLLTTASGQKMGKTHAGAVWLDAKRCPPFDFYQYWVNADDRDVGRFLRLYTLLPLDRIAELEALEGADVREAKAVLAFEVTALVHGRAAAEQAQQAARAMVAGAASDELPTHIVAASALDAGLRFANVLADSGLAKSVSEGRRLIAGGGVKFGADKVADETATVPAALPADGLVLRVGKSKAVRVLVG